MSSSAWLPKRIEAGPLIASLALGGALAALLWYRLGALGPLLAGIAALGLYLALTRRSRRRRRVAAQPFPEAWRRVLREQVEFYAKLSEPERRRFEDECRFFVTEQTITGPRGVAVDDEIRLLVAASAVALVFGRPGFRYPRLRDVVVHDDAFDEEYRVGAGKQVLGMVHGQGPILFSARALRDGFRDSSDGHNVGYHEFAHVLDFDGGHADGVPSMMPWRAVQPWLALMHTETARVERRRSVLRRYASTNEAEFFAVATEAFFERARELARKHPDLYRVLAEVYAQDPAGALEAGGTTK